MIEKIIEASLKNMFLILATVILLIASSIWAIKNISLDALPDLTPPQIIVSVQWMGQSPKLIEEQIIYPLTNALMSVANAKTVRAFSSFENALIYIIFEEGTDLYFARDRVNEILSQEKSKFSQDATIKLGADATGVGWVYEYALTSKTKSLDELRSIQDYHFKYGLLGVDGVSEVASIGGFEKNYEITLDSAKLLQYNLSIDELIKAIKDNNRDSGGRILIENGFENMIQARGYLKNIKSIEDIEVKNINSIPLKINDIAKVNIVPSYRRGVADLNGEGEVVGGIVIIRYGENAYGVIKRVKEKLKELKIEDVEVVETYDRSSLIEKAIDTLKRALVEESLIVLVVILLFLLHFRSAMVILITLPLTIAITFLLMKLFNISSNIMSLGGIAIAIGAMVDASIVMIENSHKYLQNKTNLTNKERFSIILKSTKQVGRPIFFALLLIVISFLPIFMLTGQEGALFKPLAYTKTFAMSVGAILSITLTPILMLFFIRGKIIDERKNILNRFFIFLYSPILKASLFLRYILILAVIASVFYGIFLYKEQKWEFMPPLNEETFMYMPVTPYGISIDLAKELTQKSDKLLKSFPEVKSVFGKVGRADSSTDPAPLSMIETIIEFQPKEQWREGVTYKSLLNEMEEKLQILGLTNSWTYPIRGRIDMLLTGIRTPLGIKLYGDDSKMLEKIAREIEQKLKSLQITGSVFADKSNSGYFLNIDLNQDKINEYGLTKESILKYIYSGVGGARVSTFFDGIERYPISVRLNSNERSDIRAIEEILIKTKIGFAPLKTFAKIYYEEGASVLKSERGKKVTFIYITPTTTAKEYKEVAKKLLADLNLPAGYYIEFAGESEYLESAMSKLLYIIPITILITFILIYLGLNSFSNALIVFLTIPFALVGGVIYVDYLDFNFSIAVIVGFLALVGVAVETAIVMIIYLEEAVNNLKTHSKDDLKKAIYEGAVLRVRPKLMTVFAILGGLLPIMYINGVGSEVMQRIASPMIGGVISSSILTLLVIPALYYIKMSWKK